MHIAKVGGVDSNKYRDVYYSYLLDHQVLWVYDAMKTLVALEALDTKQVSCNFCYYILLSCFWGGRVIGRNTKYFTIRPGYPTIRAASSRMHYFHNIIKRLCSLISEINLEVKIVHNHHTFYIPYLHASPVFQHLFVGRYQGASATFFSKVAGMLG